MIFSSLKYMYCEDSKVIQSTGAPFVQNVDNAIFRINHYPLNNVTGFPNTYPLSMVNSAIQILNNWGLVSN